jgi:hypothetical protein
MPGRRLFLCALVAGTLAASAAAGAQPVADGSNPRTVMIAVGKMYARIQAAESQAQFCAETFPADAPAIEAGLAKWREEDGRVIQTAQRYEAYLRGESPALKEQEDALLEESRSKMRQLPVDAQTAACKSLAQGLEQGSWREWRRRDPEMYDMLERADDIVRAAGIAPPE